MASVDNISKLKKLRPSILDRLLDDSPFEVEQDDDSTHQHLDELKESVRRDLENLLNTRRRPFTDVESESELSNSIISYGLPDLTHINLYNAEEKAAFIQHLETLIRRFEPRFYSVKVTLHETAPEDSTLNFRVDAIMHADPTPELIIFDTSVEPVMQGIEITEVDQ